jgi:hypothetical protein
VHRIRMEVPCFGIGTNINVYLVVRIHTKISITQFNFVVLRRLEGQLFDGH